MRTRHNRLLFLGGLLVGLSTAALAQTTQPATEAQARAYIFGAFLTQAAPAIMSAHVALGPELEEKLSLPSGADGGKVYEALVALTDNKRIQVRKATPEERAGYAPAKGLKEPLYTVEAGELRLLVQYDLAANNIPFVGQLGVSAEKAPLPATSVLRGNEPPPEPVLPEAAAAPPPIAVVPPYAPPPPPPVVVEKPKAAAAVQAPAAPPPEPKPPPVVETPPKGPRVIAVEPTPAPPPAPLRRSGPCVIKPVMTDQDLVNCGASPH